MATGTKVKNVKNIASKSNPQHKESNPQHKEGKVARTIEEQTAKLPSDVFLWAAVGAMACSLTLKLLKNDSASTFFGQWPAPFLLFGIYNKLVKQEGHDRSDR